MTYVCDASLLISSLFSLPYPKDSQLRDNKSEPYTSYYDIFTTNAFGSYFNILKEIAYNDIMSTWLTYYNNMSQQYQIDEYGLPTSPDENFARE